MPGDEVIPAAPLHRIAGSRSRNPQAREAARYVSVRFASMLFRKLAGGFPSRLCENAAVLIVSA
jgi:hypothetical protein